MGTVLPLHRMFTYETSSTTVREERGRGVQKKEPQEIILSYQEGWDSSVTVATGYGPDDRGLFLGGAKYFPFPSPVV
jgi:hypothetical protein